MSLPVLVLALAAAPSTHGLTLLLFVPLAVGRARAAWDGRNRLRPRDRR